ncbi:TPA: prolyl oligopeptidase family serine peptidase [Photobacterium damselae]
MILASLVLAQSVAAQPCPECWLRDDSRTNPKVISYLVDQNETTQQYLELLTEFQAKLQSEWQDRLIKKAKKPWITIGRDQYKLEDFGYGQLITRAYGNNEEQVIVDFNHRAKNYKYYRFGSWKINSNKKYIAITENIKGDDNYRIAVIDQDTGKDFLLTESKYSTSIEWLSDDQLLIIENEAVTYRPYKAKIFNLRTNSFKDIYIEKNKSWLISSYLTSDKTNIVLQSNNDNSSEQYLISTLNFSSDKPDIKLIKKRENNLEYYVDSIHKRPFVKSNRDGQFDIYEIIEDGAWEKRVTPDGEIEKWLLFNDNLVLQLNKEGRTYLSNYTLSGDLIFKYELSLGASVGWLSHNTDPDSVNINIRTMGLKQPPAWQKIDIKTGNVVENRTDVYRNFSSKDYIATQIHVKNGGIDVPVSLIYRKDRLTDTSPVILYGYGAYGVTMRPYFMPQIISLVDRGAIYAIAHVRGGGFLGEKWHKMGMGINKNKGIDDFIAVAQTMKQYPLSITKINRDILAIGSSAGGTLVAAAINKKPSLFKAAVLQVPFVDVLASMLDRSLPLTEQQYSEWGDPRISIQREIMANYSPFDNVTAKPYPALLVRTGLYDSRVPYWEAAKYILRVKNKSTDNKPYLLSTDLNSGHNSNHSLTNQAMDYAFLLSQTTNK